jgi:hypothetical protein
MLAIVVTLISSSTLNMEAIFSSETSANFQRNIWHSFQEDKFFIATAVKETNSQRMTVALPLQNHTSSWCDDSLFIDISLPSLSLPVLGIIAHELLRATLLEHVMF